MDQQQGNRDQLKGDAIASIICAEASRRAESNQNQILTIRQNRESVSVTIATRRKNEKSSYKSCRLRLEPDEEFPVKSDAALRRIPRTDFPFGRKPALSHRTLRCCRFGGGGSLSCAAAAFCGTAGSVGSVEELVDDN